MSTGKAKKVPEQGTVMVAKKSRDKLGKKLTTDGWLVPGPAPLSPQKFRKVASEIGTHLLNNENDERAPAAVGRKPGPELSANKDEAEQMRIRLLNTIEEMRHRIEFNEKLPAYLMEALTKFQVKERVRLRDIAAYFAVLRASERGAPLSRAPKNAFRVAADRLGIKVDSVERAYNKHKLKNETNRKK